MQAGDVLYTCADISKSRKTLGYNPGYDFETGITRFIEWFEKSL
jgi:UDP-glucuronate 4-epimerase